MSNQQAMAVEVTKGGARQMADNTWKMEIYIEPTDAMLTAGKYAIGSDRGTRFALVALNDTRLVNQETGEIEG